MSIKRAKIEIAAQRERERPVSDLGFGREEDKRTPSMLVLDLRLPQLFHEFRPHNHFFDGMKEFTRNTHLPSSE
ncbi:hypothetical protein ACLOJK_000616 [Asimina triloba]